MTRSPERFVVLVVSAAPPGRDAAGLVDLLQQDLWEVQVVTTPAATDWIDAAELETLTGHPVRSEPRAPTDHARS